MEQANFSDIDRDFAAPPSGCRVVRTDALSALADVPDKTFRCCVRQARGGERQLERRPHPRKAGVLLLVGMGGGSQGGLA